MDMNLTTFGARVRHLRQQVEDLACAELDRLAELHRGHVWQIEQGFRENPERDTVRGLARVLGCSVGWLLEGEGAAPAADELRAAVERARKAGTTNPVAEVA